jgi:hypothetical protein
MFEKISARESRRRELSLDGHYAALRCVIGNDHRQGAEPDGRQGHHDDAQEDRLELQYDVG